MRQVDVLVSMISIHAAHEGCDVVRTHPRTAAFKISIHAAHEGCDWVLPQPTCPPAKFQSTQPMRAATVVTILKDFISTLFQSTQPMRAATTSWNTLRSESMISIHAAHEGCDKILPEYVEILVPISIHAAHEGCDYESLGQHRRLKNFNPRSP